MFRGVIKPLVIVLSGILCVHLSVYAAESDAKKSSPPAKKEKAAPKTEVSEPKKEAAPASNQKDTAAKQEDSSSKVLATVNDKSITQGEVDKILKRYENQIPKEQIQAITRQVIEGLINQMLITQFVKDKKLEVTNENLEAEINKVRGEIKSDPNMEGKTLEQVLESHGTNFDDYKKTLALDVSVERYLSKDLDDQKIKAYFEQNKAVYDGTEVKASHILIDTREMKTDAELSQALEKIKKIKAEADSGKDFAELAKQNSDCPSKEKGGDLGFFKRKGQLVEPFAAAAYSLKAGQISEPVLTPFGYHIIKVTEIKKGNDVKFDDVKANIKQDMMQESGRLLLTQLRQNAKIEIKI